MKSARMPNRGQSRGSFELSRTKVRTQCELDARPTQECVVPNATNTYELEKVTSTGRARPTRGTYLCSPHQLREVQAKRREGRVYVALSAFLNSRYCKPLVSFMGIVTLATLHTYRSCPQGRAGAPVTALVTTTYINR